ncbi:hypothetical protein TOPH_06105 [Tolypocladium ophioglossoides CBS 100239]|uniref:Uncharacterized protein n=1 Tax=Tolypocladium ophioglossoides (strain CBS 100239) TaxID=1163406 RepID=A0A0L0N574_TOLOC|nr:hypothetical protein TOPH_06105 [Tolypocladium ophioglossoides CBS 100239]
MKFATAILALSTAVVGLQAPIEGYGIVHLEWEVEVSPGGKTVVLNGTVENVHNELVKLNPNWDEDYAAVKKPLSKRNDDDFKLAGRADFTNAHFFCRGRWPECPSPIIAGGIAYLRRIQGQPRNGPGPGNCGRVSCSHQSAIYWCNDSPAAKPLNGFNDIADGAEYINKKCVREVWNGRWLKFNAMSSGQAYHKDNWNVIVTRDTDRC